MQANTCATILPRRITTLHLVSTNSRCPLLERTTPPLPIHYINTLASLLGLCIRWFFSHDCDNLISSIYSILQCSQFGANLPYPGPLTIKYILISSSCIWFNPYIIPNNAYMAGKVIIPSTKRDNPIYHQSIQLVV